MLETGFFYAFAALTLIGAILTVTLRNAIHCALALIGSLAGVAGLYLLQKAEFLFAVQIVLYIGGIMVLFLFVIMLVNLDASARERQFHRHWIAAVICVIGCGALITWFLRQGAGSMHLGQSAPEIPSAGNVEALSEVLFKQYLVPFELASILLLVAVVGSVIMAKKRI
ncbi:NADH-quinone oxidoreductase subunit J family protein [Paludibaculum fermentans]|uniref:NADH-quinone oxidoreductase subunit J family protein n=1 Tax=Paludibaculum fermentans TaxID=1473598 RepID=UPI003EBA8C06